MFGASKTATPVSAVNYIEDVFSTWLYTGNDTSQTITNAIDLSTKGGLVWMKKRNTAFSHVLFDTARGINYGLSTDATNSNIDFAGTGITSFNTTGFSVGSDSAVNNGSMVSWTFRKQPKFFDVVTWTGNSNNSRMLSHSLGSVPGCIITKCTSTTSNWFTWHRASSITSSVTGFEVNLNSAPNTTAYDASADFTSTQFRPAAILDSSYNEPNVSGQTYVAYIFAHNAGGFGLTGTDNVISCGSYTGNGSANGPTITLGYEPQLVLIKRTDTTGNWRIYDSMRGMNYTTAYGLQPNSSNAEFDYLGPIIKLSATGFQLGSTGAFENASGGNYIYITIRRGPMKVPTLGTAVFGMSARTGTGANATVTGGQTDDAVLVKNRGSAVGDLFAARLTGTGYLETSSTAAEVAAGTTILQANPWDVMDGVKVGTTSTITNASSNTYINYLFKRAPSFFDEVCYTGNGTTQNISHNLGVTPEIIIAKSRSPYTSNWYVYNKSLTNTFTLILNGANAQDDGWGDPLPAGSVTSTTFGVSGSGINYSGSTNVAYLFATCAGVSKVGSYSGTGSTQTISCEFTGGARFVMIKRINGIADWYVWDTARGMVSGTDPSLLLNSTAAEVNANSIYTATGGFQIVSTAAGINASGGTYMFLAIA